MTEGKLIIRGSNLKKTNKLNADKKYVTFIIWEKYTCIDRQFNKINFNDLISPYGTLLKSTGRLL